MYDDAVKRAGRIVYVEPNNLNSLHPNNAIPYDYEDYALSVNLRVFCGDRNACGQPDDNNNGDLNFSSNMGTISFIGGTDGYLSTNFTDIRMNDPMSNTNECLGIETIDISYDSWYYPQVKIKFVDVRGASLMLPAEYENYNSGSDNFKSAGTRQFFKSLFTFPYPLFKLSIKGFYGREITYDLTVSDVKISFNSTTGNAEALASFIGYMYGVYTEVSMPFLAVSPYISYESTGRKHWENKKNNGEFSFMDGNSIDTPMMTFPEIVNAVANVSENARKMLKNSVEGKRMGVITSLLRAMGDVQIAFSDIMRDFSVYDAGEQYLFFQQINGKEKIDSADKEREIIRSLGNFKRKIDAYNEIAVKNEEVNLNCLVNEKIINDIATIYLTELKEKGDDTKVDFNGIANDYLTYITFTAGEDGTSGSTSIKMAGKDDNRIATKCELSDTHNPLKDFIDSVMVGNGTEDKTGIRSAFFNTNGPKYIRVYFLKINSKNPIQELDAINKRLKDEREKLIERLKELKRESMKEGLGFNPTIRNIFNLTFAHMNTFVYTFYECLSKIKRQMESGERKVRDYVGGDKGVMSDLSDKYVMGNKDVPLPPFVSFYQEKTLSKAENGSDKNYEIIWPGNLPDGENLEEVKLVRAIVEATAMYHGEFNTDTETKKNEGVTSNTGYTNSFYPITQYDMVNPYTNPYVTIVSRFLGKEDILERLLFVFSLRCYYFFLTNGNITNSDSYKAFGAVEADNMLKAINSIGYTPSKALITALLATKSNVNAYVNNFVSECILKSGLKFLPDMNRTAIFNTGIGNTRQLVYNWLRKNGFWLPIGGFSINSMCNDILSDGVLEKENYINTTDLKINQNSFNLLADSLYLERLRTKIYSDSNLDEATKGLLKNFEENITSIPSEISESGYIKKYVNIENYDKEIVTFDDIYRSYNCDGNCDGIKIEYPSVIATNVNGETADYNILFAHPIYYNQNTKESKAYLFVFGVPVSGENLLLPNAKSSTVPEIMLLREGAFYWRKMLMDETNEDPINIKSNGGQYCKSATENEAYCIQIGKNIHLSPIPVNSNLSYCNVSIPVGATESRKKRLIKRFLSFANGMNFATIDNNYGLQTVISDDGERRTVTPNEVLSLPSDKIYNNGVYSSLGNGGNKVRNGLTPTEMADSLSAALISSSKAVNSVLCDFSTTIDYATTYDKNTVITLDNYKLSVQSAIEKLNEIIKPESVVEERTSGIVVRKDLYGGESYLLSIYESLRILYNKWFSSNRKETWDFNVLASKADKQETDFGKFRFMDTFFHDIGDKLIVNMQSVFGELKDYTTQGNNGVAAETALVSNSMYTYLATLCQKNGMTFIALPSLYGLTFDEDGNSVADMFRPIPFNEAKRMNNKNSTYVALYTYKLSENLNLTNDSAQYNYDNDGIMIANASGQILAKIPSNFADGDDTSYLIPAFGVTFGKQNQSYFKNVRVSMDNGMQTEPALRQLFNIAAQATQTPRSTELFGQDLYRLYSSYSYQCHVDMMGDSQIMPLMYFQLNNIPMFNGLYMIFKVNHNITPDGNMATSFDGVRINKKSLPFVEPDIIYIDDDYPEDDEFNNEQQESGKKDSNVTAGANPVDLKTNKYAQTVIKFNNGQWNGDVVDGGGNVILNIYNPLTDGLNKSYLTKHGWNKDIDGETYRKYNENYSESKINPLLYLVIDICENKYNDVFTGGTEKPPYNIYIDENGYIKYPWRYVNEERGGGKKVLSEKYMTTASHNYSGYSMNLAFYGKWKNGKIEATPETIRTLQEYIVAFANYKDVAKVIGMNQINYNGKTGKPYSPGFNVPKLTNSLSENIKNKKLAEKVRNICIETDVDIIMPDYDDVKGQIGKDEKHWVHIKGRAEDVWTEYGKLRQSGVR